MPEKAKISGFSMGRNTAKLYYPVKQSIESILPLVDEFVFALGDCEADDRTRAEIESINSDKVKIIDTVWDLQKYPRGMEHAHQTDIAREACSGDWLFYLQADEVVHENDLPVIRKRCDDLLNNTLSQLETRLDPEKFFRIHRSSIVNLNYVRKIEADSSGGYTITTLGRRPANLSVSRTAGKVLRNKLGW